jgi:hypothetical protein
MAVQQGEPGVAEGFDPLDLGAARGVGREQFGPHLPAVRRQAEAFDRGVRLDGEETGSLDSLVVGIVEDGGDVHRGQEAVDPDPGLAGACQEGLQWRRRAEGDGFPWRVSLWRGGGEPGASPLIRLRRRQSLPACRRRGPAAACPRGGGHFAAG